MAEAVVVGSVEAGFCCLGKNAMSRTFFTVKVGDTRSQSKRGKLV